MKTINNIPTSMQFDDKGLFISLISYPFTTDGKTLFNESLKASFNAHKENLMRYDPSGLKDQTLYEAQGYRLFASQGLLILSLVDDYNFSSRHFNKNHLKTAIEHENDFDFKSAVMVGTVEMGEDTDLAIKYDSLTQKAKDTFLRDKDRYPYIGLIRIKIDHRLLLGKDHGVLTVRKIKNRIDILKSKHVELKGCNADCIVVDCYNNDELSVLAFSDDILFLYDFMGEIRSIKNTDDGIKQPYKKGRNCLEKHMFSSTFIAFGYHVHYDLSQADGVNNDSFLPAKDLPEEKYEMTALIETKTGHRDVFYDYLKEKTKSFGLAGIDKNISGGCSIIVTLPLKCIIHLEKLCQEDSIFHRDVRKIKVSLKDVAKRTDNGIDNDNHASSGAYNDLIKRDYIALTKALLKEIGVSKMVRERMMSLFDLYNSASHDLIHRFYLNELRPAFLNYGTILKDMYDDDYSIREIEEALNNEITNMENACYDRLHAEKRDVSLLEYSGGIQQHLTAFDYAYKRIYGTFCRGGEESFYVAITGAERASSERTLFKLNINDIVFPELFITTVWKEIANFALKIFDDKKDQASSNSYFNEIKQLTYVWNDFSQHEDSFAEFHNALVHDELFYRADPTFRIVESLYTRNLLNYFFKDYFVFHFAFQEDFWMMWHFYFKTMLQTTISYRRLSEINRPLFIHMLLRLFIIGRLCLNGEQLKELESQVNKPFDSLLGAAWFESYGKVFIASEIIYKSLSSYDFAKMNSILVNINELNINSNYSVSCERSRQQQSEGMRQHLRNGELIDYSGGSETEFIIRLFGAYLRELYDLDEPDKIIKCLPRDIKGQICSNMVIRKGEVPSALYKDMIGVLVDPTGGFFIPSGDVRKKYFRLKTGLYRNLWNVRFLSSKPEE